jgi:UDP-N-acetyl-D-mannosaminuronic acid transferase (WecB/TagA/CpsF family)
MSAVGDHLAFPAAPLAGGLAFHDLDWDSALGLAESLARLQGGRNVVSFLDAGLVARRILRPVERQTLSRHLLLPGAGAISTTVLRAFGMSTKRRRFSPSAFVPALLTYAEKPLRIAVTGDVDRDVEALKDHLQRHAPWHRVIAASPAIDCDLLIVCARRFSKRMELAGRFGTANLTLLAGGELMKVVARRG